MDLSRFEEGSSSLTMLSGKLPVRRIRNSGFGIPISGFRFPDFRFPGPPSQLPEELDGKTKKERKEGAVEELDKVQQRVPLVFQVGFYFDFIFRLRRA